MDGSAPEDIGFVDFLDLFPGFESAISGNEIDDVGILIEGGIPIEFDEVVGHLVGGGEGLGDVEFAEADETPGIIVEGIEGMLAEV